MVSGIPSPLKVLNPKSPEQTWLLSAQIGLVNRALPPACPMGTSDPDAPKCFIFLPLKPVLLHLCPPSTQNPAGHTAMSWTPLPDPLPHPSYVVSCFCLFHLLSYSALPEPPLSHLDSELAYFLTSLLNSVCPSLEPLLHKPAQHIF